ncbi:S41 family peptidase [Nitrospirillum pindoramense]|uniref:Peptidase S41-like protein n=1 Tax=Nitrospirillum amazonense TaxID=28077 RepID=A0A560H0S4_9PROT|nr:S41 family peptidase [Nitrospirillum amazonense]TWB39731.1 peptidase S41-like protein [Nitrospirillum amazonense]
MRRLLPLLLGIGLICATGRAADIGEAPLPSAQVAEVVAAISRLLHDHYPLPDIAARYERGLERGLKAGRFEGKGPCALAETLTRDLRTEHEDRHLTIRCGAGHADDREVETGPYHGIAAVQVDPDLPVATIRSPGPWVANEDGFASAAAAMALAARSHYVIIDVRGNGGGNGEIGVFLATYFFPVGQQRLLVRGVHRDPAREEQEWTYGYVPGRRLTDAKLYILVDGHTGSAAEGFAFGLQRAGRATIVGQTTAGAGIAGHWEDLPGGLSLFLPIKLLRAPDGSAGWEGVGVRPDVVTEPGQEMTTVYNLIRADWPTARENPDFVQVITLPPERRPSPDTTAPPWDAGQPTLPQVERCRSISPDPEDDTVRLMTNVCNQPILLEERRSAAPASLRLITLESGQSLASKITPPGGWWIMAVCPQGYRSGVPVTAENIGPISRGAYACVKE